VIALLLEHGADAKQCEKELGDTALHVAVRAGQLKTVRALLDNGADPEARNGNGETPLDLAVASGQREVAAVLRDHGFRKGPTK
jgi:uncharacterized protein